MKTERDPKEPVAEWKNVPGRIQETLRGLNDSDLDLRGGSEGWSIRYSEYKKAAFAIENAYCTLVGDRWIDAPQGAFD